MSRVYISRIQDGALSPEQVLRALEWLQWERWFPVDARVFIKPNLTWPVHIPGVTTTPQAIEAVVAALKSRTRHIVVGESDGGYHSFQAEEAFQGHGLYEIANRYGIRIVNLSRQPSVEINLPIAGRQVKVELPRVLVEETDVFVTLPVPKVHVMTGVSLAFKNQWGCLPHTMRLREHPEFDRKILAINRALSPRLVIFDGTYFLDRSGPLAGEAVPLNLLICSDSVGAGDAVCCAVMGIEPMSIRHFRLARQEGMFPQSLAEVTLNTPLEPFLGHRFEMKRALIDWISLLGFRNGRMAWLFWDSPFADLLHRILYFVRRNRLIQQMLYGKVGAPPEWRPSKVASAGDG